MSESSGTSHEPVLAEEVLELLGPALSTGPRPVQTGFAGDAPVVVDATVGLGGHARRFLERMGPPPTGCAGGRLIGLDVDPAALERARGELAAVRGAAHAGGTVKVDLIQANFAELPQALDSVGVQRVHVILADLGVSSMQLGAGERGFSFQTDGPLDMRMDPRLTTTAADLVNRLKEKELGDLLFYNAQEFAARKIARRICEDRRDSRITTTGRLARLVAQATGVRDPYSRKAKIHPATRAFMALRMAVNDEIPNLRALLAAAPDRLVPGGRIGIISFHSVEDKEVKVDFRARSREGVYELVTKKPMNATEEERRANPRSRSAKMRVAIRT